MSEVFVFAKWDKSLVPTLRKYYQFCKWAGCDKQQLDSVENKIQDVERWQEKNADRVKNADI